ncbi:hypothetical protein F7734_57835 [Scytonema sp. UIC 10036]|uniref:Tic22 family protein n=1 Tax=Scytonema sp. UIC 10036 TaxID=2304196 RepID=UPI0012DA4F22|nr:Tic22 family protein [Scytonema sp. UIC 10036]MUH01425.1 hypothetical protein [Scytonema sp. UIC 10036]
MKSLIRWSTTVTLVGSTLLATIFSGAIPVLALTEQQIKEKLDSVPVFLITNNKGVPLTRIVPVNPKNGQNEPKKDVAVRNVFMSGQEAQTILNQLSDAKKKDPKLAEVLKEGLQIKIVPLGAIYQELQATANKPDRILYILEPAKQEIQEAMTLLRQSGKEVKQMVGVPVFIVTSPALKGYVPAKRNNKDVIPLYLSKKDAQNFLQQAKTRDPKADIQVVDIDNVIKNLREKNDPWLTHIDIVPSTESIQYVVSKQGNAKPPAVAPGSKPAAAPKK